MGAPVQIIILGASGDLTARKLVPALAGLAGRNEPAEGFQLVGVARRPFSDSEFRTELQALQPPEGQAEFAAFAQRVHYQSGDVTRIEDALALAARLDALSGGAQAGRLFYFSLAPGLFRPAVDNLARAGLLAAGAVGPWRRVVLEKPFGRDLAIGPGPQPAPPGPPAGGADLPDRPLPGQGDGAEPVRLPLQQHRLRAGLEPPARGAGADHRGRADRGGAGPHGLLRHRRRPERHGAEPHAADAGDDRHGAAVLAGPRGGARPEGGLAEEPALPRRPERASGATGRGSWTAGRCPATWTKAPRRAPAPRPSWRCGRRSRTGAGAGCPSCSGTASGWPSASRR